MNTNNSSSDVNQKIESIITKCTQMKSGNLFEGKYYFNDKRSSELLSEFLNDNSLSLNDIYNALLSLDIHINNRDSEEGDQQLNRFRADVALKLYPTIVYFLQRNNCYSIPPSFLKNQLLYEALCTKLTHLEKLKPYISILSEYSTKYLGNKLLQLKVLDAQYIDELVIQLDRYHQSKLNETELVRANEKHFDRQSESAIVLNVLNCGDGVGDYQTFIKMARALKLYTDTHGLQLVGILSIQRDILYKLKTFIRNFIAESLETHNPFDQLFIFDEYNDSEKIKLNKTDSRIKIHSRDYPVDSMIEKILSKNAELYINIVYNTFNINASGNTAPFSKALRPYVPLIACGELGQAPIKQKRKQDDIIRADMGLPYDKEPYIHGLLIEPSKTINENTSKTFYDGFKEQDYLNAILDTTSIEEYKKNNVFNIGYLQSTSSANTFILTNILKNSKNGKLEKNIDFHINDSALRISELLTFLKGIDPKDIVFLNPNNLKQQLLNPKSNNKQIRIFYGFKTDDKDLYSLYALCQYTGGAAACSGDNSFTELVSYECVPFFATKSTGVQFYGDFLNFQLKCFLSNSSPPYKTILKYLEVSINNINDNYQTQKTCHELADILNSDSFKEEWVRFITQVKQDYNYYNKLPVILDNILSTNAKTSKIVNVINEMITLDDAQLQKTNEITSRL